jgi:hypothetical protein
MIMNNNSRQIKKKTMKMKQVILGIFICCVGFAGKAQTNVDSIGIASAKIGLDSLAGNGASYLSIRFFVNNVSDLQTVYVKVGTLPGAVDLLQEELTVKNHKGRFYYYTNSKNEIIRNWGGHSLLSYGVDQSDVVKAKWVTIYTKNNNGVQSALVNYQIH